MTLISTQFAVFCLVFFAGHFSLKNSSYRSIWIAFSGLALFTFYNPALLPFLILIAVGDYYFALAIDQTKSPRLRKLLLISSIAMNLGVLIFFKYRVFVFHDILKISLSKDWRTLGNTLGLSFFTFESLSYIVDVYRRRTPPIRSFLLYVSFLSYFPHLFAGPIVRASEFAREWRHSTFPSARRFGYGSWLVIRGCFRKIVIADTFASVSRLAFESSPPTALTTATGILAFTIQIYADFSGYSDIARGLAYMIGIRIRINFNNPYLSRGPGEFWKRWHISLSRWFRDYVYIPLGGNRSGIVGLSLLTTMFLCGLWHGAEWKFAIWGLYHGWLLCVALLFRKLISPTVQSRFGLSRQVLTFCLVAIGWTIFRATDFSQALWHLSIVAKGLAASGPSVLRFALALILLDISLRNDRIKYLLFCLIFLTVSVSLLESSLQMTLPVGIALSGIAVALLEPVLKGGVFWRVFERPFAVCLETSLMIIGIFSFLEDNGSEFLYFQF
jgi:alginate O-acetyltransferase complex protein AlgI